MEEIFIGVSPTDSYKKIADLPCKYFLANFTDLPPIAASTADLQTFLICKHGRNALKGNKFYLREMRVNQRSLFANERGRLHIIDHLFGVQKNKSVYLED